MAELVRFRLPTYLEMLEFIYVSFYIFTNSRNSTDISDVKLVIKTRMTYLTKQFGFLFQIFWNLH